MDIPRNIFGGLLLLIAIQISSQLDLSKHAKLINPNEYFAKVIQETFYELENRGFCNLKLNDFNQTIDENLYNWHVKGYVEYTDGFLHSIGRITVTNISGDILMPQTGGAIARFSGDVEMVPATVGYDVTAHLGDQGVHRFTGTFRHPQIKFNFNLRKSLNIGNMTVSTSSSVGAGSGLRMVYMPESSFSEVLSRKFFPETFSSAAAWARDVIAPIMVEKAKVIPFPKLCFVNNPQKESC